jgi:hypothetical protein
MNAIPIRKNIPEQTYALRETPEGQVRVSDKVCKKCIYHTLFGVSDRLIGCMYADREHHCRTLDADYVHGYCKYFQKGKRKTGEPFRSTYFRAEVAPWTLHER